MPKDHGTKLKKLVLQSLCIRCWRLLLLVKSYYSQNVGNLQSTMFVEEEWHEGKLVSYQFCSHLSHIGNDIHYPFNLLLYKIFRRNVQALFSIMPIIDYCCAGSSSFNQCEFRDVISLSWIHFTNNFVQWTHNVMIKDWKDSQACENVQRYVGVWYLSPYLWKIELVFM